MKTVFVVGRNDGGLLQKTSQEATVTFATLCEAERFLEDQKSLDPVGVHRGDYYIDKVQI